MIIETKFKIGELVYFIQDDMLYRREVRCIMVEVRRNCVNPEKSPSVVITYYFDNMPSRGSQEVYKYESEVAATKEDLINGLPER